MKNNRGFTLVELLAVIVLIAVLSVVAVSTYRGINESSKQKTLDAKIEQITTAAEKWARENNITTKTTLSVNTLVVEGYITADSVGTDGLAVIKNPVNGENMICNVVELTFKDGIVKSVFNGNIYNCKLASQSLVDSNINIRVVSSSNKNLTGSGSIAKWTNEDIVVIVNSTQYDTKATSISYDLEGSTITKNKDTLSKYTGTSYVSNPDSYYNVYPIKSELLLNTKLVITYDIPGEGTKSRAYTIRFDKEEATALVFNNTEWLTDEQSVIIKADDGKGSGPKNIYISQNENSYDATNPIPIPGTGLSKTLEVGKYYVWTEDNAGNISHDYKLSFEVNNTDKVKPGCEILFDGTEGTNGWYISNVTPGAQNDPAASVSGVNIGISRSTVPAYSGFAQYQTQTLVQTDPVTTETTREGINYYCYAKSLAGKTGTNERNLKIDKTPPELVVIVESPDVYTRTKNLRYEFKDSLSGIVDPLDHIRFKIVKGNGSITSDETISSYSEYQEFVAVGGAGFDQSGIDTTLTGIFHLVIVNNGLADKAGNRLIRVTVNGEEYAITPGDNFIPLDLLFDNSAPSCAVTNLGNQCTTGGLSLTVTCSDAHSGVASCPGVQSNITSDQTYLVTDNAGNSSSCGVTVNSTTQYHKASCNQYAYCQHSECGTCGGNPYACNTVCDYCGGNACGQLPYCPISAYWCDCESDTCYTPTYTCSCRTPGCGCGSWNDWQAWQNTAITGCNQPDCKSESRTVFHTAGVACNGNTPSGSATGLGGTCTNCGSDAECYRGTCSGTCSNIDGRLYTCCVYRADQIGQNQHNGFTLQCN